MVVLLQYHTAVTSIGRLNLIVTLTLYPRNIHKDEELFVQWSDDMTEYVANRKLSSLSCILL